MDSHELGSPYLLKRFADNKESMYSLVVRSQQQVTVTLRGSLAEVTGTLFPIE